MLFTFKSPLVLLVLIALVELVFLSSDQGSKIQGRYVPTRKKLELSA
ncbi:MAG: hypothetical protein SFX18_20370 [Pirellulales bacterium]|nr:hypothetical protein [Pirellulales bacterium]